MGHDPLFHQPIAATVSGRPLYCDYMGASYLGIHGSYMLFAFTPSMTLAASALWLLADAGRRAGRGRRRELLVARRILGDDLAAACSPARPAERAHGPRRAVRVPRRGVLPARDLPAGARAARATTRPSRWEKARRSRTRRTLLVCSSSRPSRRLPLRYASRTRSRPPRRRLLVTSRIACRTCRTAPPTARGTRPTGRVGTSMPQAALGMLRHPFALATGLVHSGIPHLLEPLLFLPLVGHEGLVAASRSSSPTGPRTTVRCREFAIYYALSVLPFLFIGAAYGLARLARTQPRRRIGARLVMAVCAIDGAGWTFPRADPAGGDSGPALAALGAAASPDPGHALSARRARGRAPRARQGAPARRRGSRAPRSRREPLPVHRRRDDGADPAPGRGPALARSETPHGLLLFSPRD